MPPHTSGTSSRFNAILSSPWQVLRTATASVPATRYALAVSGIAAALALAVEFVGNKDPASIKSNLVGVAAMLILMVVMIVLAALARVAPSKLHVPAIFLVWAMLLLVVSSSFLTIGCLFFRWPKSFPELSSELFGVDAPKFESTSIPEVLSVANFDAWPIEQISERIKLNLIDDVNYCVLLHLQAHFSDQTFNHAYPVATGLPFVAQSNACPSSPMRRLAHVIW